MRDRRRDPRAQPGKDAGEAGEALAEEIAVLRDLLQRVGAMAGEERSLSEMLKLLDVYSMSSGRLGSLLKIQRMLESGQNQEEVRRAMEAIIESLSGPGGAQNG